MDPGNGDFGVMAIADSFRSDRTSARKMYAMRECMLKHDIG